MGGQFTGLAIRLVHQFIIQIGLKPLEMPECSVHQRTRVVTTPHFAAKFRKLKASDSFIAIGVPLDKFGYARL
jgi:hypothetical protein